MVSSREYCCFLHELTFSRQLSGQNVDADGSVEPILAHPSFLRMPSLPLINATAFFLPYSAILRLPSAIECSQLSTIEDCPQNFTPYSLPCLIHHIGVQGVGPRCVPLHCLIFPSLLNSRNPSPIVFPFSPTPSLLFNCSHPIVSEPITFQLPFVDPPAYLTRYPVFPRTEWRSEPVVSRAGLRL